MALRAPEKPSVNPCCTAPAARGWGRRPGTGILASMPDLTRADLVDGFRASGLAPGSIVLVHSALRTLGRVEGGAETVRDALLDVLGPTGTLVAPTFTFIHEVEPQPPLIDPAQDRSEMGAITEAVRRHPEARRSAAYRHSFAAVGPAAATIADVDPALAPFDLESSFGVDAPARRPGPAARRALFALDEPSLRGVGRPGAVSRGPRPRGAPAPAGRPDRVDDHGRLPAAAQRRRHVLRQPRDRLQQARADARGARRGGDRRGRQRHRPAVRDART